MPNPHVDGKNYKKAIVYNTKEEKRKRDGGGKEEKYKRKKKIKQKGWCTLKS